MKQKSKIISRISALSLALILILSSLVTAFGETSGGGYIASAPFGVYWKEEVPFEYTDALGKHIVSSMGPRVVTPADPNSDIGSASAKGYFCENFFLEKGQSISSSDYSQRGFCIEPEKFLHGRWLEGYAIDESDMFMYQSIYNETNNADYLANTHTDAYDKRLTPEKKKLVTYVLANGYGNYVPADAAHIAYWYATQLLIDEVIADRRDSNFGVVNGGFNPTACLTTSSGAKTSVAAIQQAYNDIVGWVRLTLMNPHGTSANSNTAPTHIMQYSDELGKYYYDYDFDSIIRQDLMNSDDYAANLYGFNIKESDIQVNSDDISFTIDNDNKRIRFTSNKPIDGSVTISFNNPRIRGINESLAITAPNGLKTIEVPYSNYQTTVKGSAKLIDRPAYFKLRTYNSMKLQMVVKPSDAEFVANNPNYSLAGAVYGVYSDSACETLVGTMTTNENGEAIYNSGAEIPNKTLWAKEINPSQGYDKNTKVYNFTLIDYSNDGVPIYSFTSRVVPKYNKVYITLDGHFFEWDSLEGAQIKVNLYEGQYSSVNELKGIEPIISMVLESDSEGNADCKIPLCGTVTVQEIKAPSSGYHKPNKTVFVEQSNNNPLDFYISHEDSIIGDINNDGYIDTLDAILVEKYSVGKSELTEQQIFVADVNNDGSVDILDSTLIQKYAVEKITKFKKVI